MNTALNKTVKGLHLEDFNIFQFYAILKDLFKDK
jgi:hypothetical protein